ncbi:MAG: baseplate J/gp47 family protein [Phormidesmis sp.]
MSRAQYHCQQNRRRAAVRSWLLANGMPRLNGIDYLEVTDDPRTLHLYFIHPLVPPDSFNQTADLSIGPDNIALTGGSRLHQIRVESVSAFDRQLVLRVNRKGDFSTYTLRLISLSDEANPPPGIDSQLAQVDFSFWANGESGYDAQPPNPPSALPPLPPVIDYLAKDYASFRQLMLDRLTVTLPNWQARNPADIGVLLVELLAYRGDQLSYFQDAVATEAYLNTARKRVSVRRHARVLDYAMHDGCNARAWVAFKVKTAVTLPGPTEQRPGTLLLTEVPTLPKVLKTEVEQLAALSAGAQTFETMETVGLHPALNELHFYTWGNQSCVLPVGATQATLVDTGGVLQLLLRVGQVLVFEELCSPQTGLMADADLHHRHGVRLTAVIPTEDPLFLEAGEEETERPCQRLVTVRWAAGDALPFELSVSAQVGGRSLNNISVAWGNVVLADHGRTIMNEGLSPLPADPTEPYRPRLRFGPLTQQGYVFNAIERRWQSFDRTGTAASAGVWQLAKARPSITLQAVLNEGMGGQESGGRWQAQKDLLKSGPFALDFVPETETGGEVNLRFGDNVLGRRPNQPLQTQYRIGNGRLGNVGAKSITHVYLPTELPTDGSAGNSTAGDSTAGDSTEGSSPAEIAIALSELFNPLPATGGVDLEPIETVKLFAPEAFRTPQRAVTTADYAHFAQQFPGVQRAIATRRWTGSWYTLFITVDRAGGESVDAAFEAELLAALEPVRLAGHDLKIESPRFVPLDIALRVQVAPDYFVQDVEAALCEAFSHQVQADGGLGFFHPDHFTFGQPVYLSQIVAAAVQIVGVRSVMTTRFQRWGQAARHELDSGQILLDRLEIAQLNNDLSLPEQGRLMFEMEGGL